MWWCRTVESSDQRTVCGNAGLWNLLTGAGNGADRAEKFT